MISTFKPYGKHSPRVAKYKDTAFDWTVYRDVLILVDNKLYINEKVYPFNEYTLSQLIKNNHVNKDKYKKASNSRYLIWYYTFSDSELEGLLGENSLLYKIQKFNPLLPKQKNGCQYWISDNFLLVSCNVIIPKHYTVVNSERFFSEIKKFVDDYNNAHRYLNFCTNTQTSTAIKLIERKYGYDTDKDELCEETKENRRYPGPGITESLTCGNKAGIVWHNPEYEEQFVTDVYGFDSSSSYPSHCFYGDFPLGELKRYKPTSDNAYGLFCKGYWFVAEFVSSEIIEMPNHAFRPYKKKGTKKYTKFSDGYHYTITPYDLKNLTEHMGYNPFTDSRLLMTKLAATNKIGYLNKKYLDFVYKVYQEKSVACGNDRDLIKTTMNAIIGRGHPYSLVHKDSGKQRIWYLNNYLCPQFSQHILARQRYTITSLACKLGLDKVLSLSTDCIKSTDPALIDIIAEFNAQHKAHMDSLGYANTTLGTWQPEHYRWLVFIRDCVYFGETTEGKFKFAHSSFELPADFKLPELFESNRIERTKNKCGDLWTSTENRLKAKEDYYGFKMEEHV